MAAVAVACYSLPLVPARILPALLAMAFLFIMAKQPSPPYRLALPILAVAGGWFASWAYRFNMARLSDLVDLALVGPVLAFGAMCLRPRRLQSFLVLGGLVAAATAVLQYSMGIVTPAHWGGNDWTRGRAFATLGNPNVLAAYLAAVMPLALAASWPRRIRYPAFCLLVLASLTTASRGGWLAGLVGLAVLCWHRRPRSLPVLFALVAAAVLLPWPVSDRLLSIVRGADPSVMARIIIWRRSILVWLDKPIGGWGTVSSLAGTHPHSLPLETLVRGGLLATAGFVPLAVVGARNLLRRPQSSTGAAASAAIMALLTFGLGDALLLQPALAGIFWLCWGIVVKEAGRYGGSKP